MPIGEYGCPIIFSERIILCFNLKFVIITLKWTEYNILRKIKKRGIFCV